MRELGSADSNPIAQRPPECVVPPLAAYPALGPVLLVGEAFSEGGRQTALDQQFDYLLILIGAPCRWRRFDRRTRRACRPTPRQSI